jgi:hypothetical protein
VRDARGNPIISVDQDILDVVTQSMLVPWVETELDILTLTTKGLADFLALLPWDDTVTCPMNQKERDNNVTGQWRHLVQSSEFLGCGWEVVV